MARIAIDARKLQDFGIGTYVQSLLSGLAAIVGDDEVLVVLPPGGRLPTPSQRFRTITSRAKNYGLAEHITLPLAVRRARVDLYHTPHYVLPWLAPRPSVVTIHDLIHLRFPEYLPSRGALLYAKAILARSFRTAARVLTVSEATRRDLLDRFGGPPEHVSVIPNSVPEVFFEQRPREDLDQVRERWSLGRHFILYAGNVKPHKNLERLLTAFARVREKADLPDLELVLMGNQLDRYLGLRRLAAELDVADHVRFLGWLPHDDLCAVYRLAHVFAYPSLFEGFGLPPLEAMASGVPVVASNTSSLPEVCGDAAILVDPLEVEAIADGLLRAVGDDAVRDELIARGQLRAQKFRGRAQAERTLQVYRELIA